MRSTMEFEIGRMTTLLQLRMRFWHAGRAEAR